jgi:hypothetical protein
MVAVVASVQPATAATFPWIQNGGFVFPGSDASGTLRAGSAFGGGATPIAGNGGLEFSGQQLDANDPAGTYSQIMWGCVPDGNPGPGTNCVNGGTLANVQVNGGAETAIPNDDLTVTPPVFGGRSALQVRTFDSGQSGLLDSTAGEAGAVRIARINHLNRTLDSASNTLKAISTLARLVVTGASPALTDRTVAITFTETPNLGPCPSPNPLGSTCDDIFTFVGEFQDIPFQNVGGQNFFLQFRLRPPAECTLDHTDGTIEIFNCPDDPDTPTNEAHQVAIDFATGRAWSPEGFDNALEIWAFLTEEPISTGDDGCTPGYWKQSQHFGSYAAPFSPNQTMFNAFAPFGGTPNFPKVKNKADINENVITLQQALSQGGGDTNALLRHFIAAVLNAANNNVNSQYENIPEIVTAVKAVLAGQTATLGGQQYNTVDALKNALAASNEGGCPLGRDPGDI